MDTFQKELSRQYRMYRKSSDPEAMNVWFKFINELPQERKVDVSRRITSSIEAQDRLRDYQNSYRFVTRIRKYCNEFGYNDVRAYEVVRVISFRCVEVRRLKATLLTKMEFVPGGFSAVCLNNGQQEYKFEQQPDAGIFRIHLGKKGWHGGAFRMSDTPYEKYDFNF